MYIAVLSVQFHCSERLWWLRMVSIDRDCSQRMPVD